MLRRYGVMSQPAAAARALACEGAICAGQLLLDRTAKGLGGRLRGWRAARGLDRRELDGAALLDLSAREALALRRRAPRLSAGAEPAPGQPRGRRRRGAARGARPAQRAAAAAAPRACPAASARSRRWAAARASAPTSTAAIRGSAPRRHELDLGGEAVAGDEPRVPGARAARSPASQEALPTCQTTAAGVAGEAPAGDPRPHVEVDVLVEGEVALVVAAELGRSSSRRSRQAAPQTPKTSRGRSVPRRCGSPGPVLEGAAVGGSAPGRRCRGARVAGSPRPAPRAGGCAAARRRAPGSAVERRESAARRSRARARCRRSGQHQRRRGAGGAEVDRGGETDVARQRDVRDPALAQQLDACRRSEPLSTTSSSSVARLRRRANRGSAAGARPSSSSESRSQPPAPRSRMRA